MNARSDLALPTHLEIGRKYYISGRGIFECASEVDSIPEKYRFQVPRQFQENSGKIYKFQPDSVYANGQDFVFISEKEVSAGVILHGIPTPIVLKQLLETILSKSQVPSGPSEESRSYLDRLKKSLDWKKKTASPLVIAEAIRDLKFLTDNAPLLLGLTAPIAQILAYHLDALPGEAQAYLKLLYGARFWPTGLPIVPVDRDCMNAIVKRREVGREFSPEFIQSVSLPKRGPSPGSIQPSGVQRQQEGRVQSVPHILGLAVTNAHVIPENINPLSLPGDKGQADEGVLKVDELKTKSSKPLIAGTAIFLTSQQVVPQTKALQGGPISLPEISGRKETLPSKPVPTGRRFIHPHGVVKEEIFDVGSKLYESMTALISDPFEIKLVKAAICFLNQGEILDLSKLFLAEGSLDISNVAVSKNKLLLDGEEKWSLNKVRSYYERLLSILMFRLSNEGKLIENDRRPAVLLYKRIDKYSHLPDELVFAQDRSAVTGVDEALDSGADHSGDDIKAEAGGHTNQVGVTSGELIGNQQCDLLDAAIEASNQDKGVVSFATDSPVAAVCDIPDNSHLTQINPSGRGSDLPSQVDVDQVETSYKFCPVIPKDPIAERLALVVTPGLQHAFRLVSKLARAYSLPILFQGATGTGKTRLAEYLHAVSPRAENLFRVVDLSQSPSTTSMLEDLLFGHEKGAYTDAQKERRGILEEIDGGTILLDEIGVTNRELQSKLQRVVETGEFSRLGSNKTIKVDIRFLFASSSNLAELVSFGLFGEDFYYRLKGAQVDIPRLHDRPQDVIPLAEHLLEQASKVDKLPGKNLSEEAKRSLLSHNWPGNTRELQSEMRRALAVSHTDEIVSSDFSFGCT